MPTQSINLGNTDVITFNNNDVQELYLNSTKIWEKPTQTLGNYIKFSSSSSFTLATNNNSKNWNGTLEYSTDETNWYTWSGTSAISSNNNVLYLRGTGNTYISQDMSNWNNSKGFGLTGSGIKLEGNIENILDYQTVALGNNPTIAVRAFFYLFNGNTALTDISNFSIGTSTSTMNTYCCNRMFGNCTNITDTCKLPAMTLAQSCYYGIFGACTGLTTISLVLPATTMMDSCYTSMFENCSNLVNPPALRATTLASNCYSFMFRSASKLASLPAFPATGNLPNGCYNNIFSWCSLIKVSETQTGIYVNEYRIPSSGSATSGTNSLNNMFAYTGGTFKSTPTANTTYYTSNNIIA